VSVGKSNGQNATLDFAHTKPTFFP